MDEQDEKLIAGGKVMSLMDHLDELRRRLTKAVIGIFVIFFGMLATGNMLLEFLKEPLVAALPAGATALHFTGPMDVMFVQMKVAFLAAFVFGAPIWIYQFWKFFEPALFPHERRYILPFIIATVLLFGAGIAFCYIIMLPMALKFLIGMGMEVGAPIITVTDYVDLVILLALGMGIVFETPVVLVLLALLNIIDDTLLVRNRKLIVVAILIIAAILTPPDPVSQIIMAAPMYILFEISVVIVRFVSRRKKKNETSSTALTTILVAGLIAGSLATASESHAAAASAPKNDGPVRMQLPAGAGDSTRIEPPVRNNIWTVGISGVKHNLKSTGANEVLGRAGMVSLGLGYIAKSWFTTAAVDFILGPYEPTRSNEVDADYTGTGVTAWWGYSAQTLDLRSVDGGYGFALGLSYADIIGRSAGPNRKSPDDPYAPENEGLVDGYQIQVNALSVIPAVFFTWLAPARPRGNTPELLTTRLEGWFLTLGAAVPLDASFKAKYDRRLLPDPNARLSSSEPVRESGPLNGYSIILSLSGLLGV